MKKYFFISGFNTRENNRGTAALGYGAVSFLLERRLLDHNQTIINLRRNSLKGLIKMISHGKNPFCKDMIISAEGKELRYKTVWLLDIEIRIHRRMPWLAKFLRYDKIISKIDCVAAINGGDGFSDIYGQRIFRNRLYGIKIAMENNIPLVMLPQTLGPFENKKTEEEAIDILRYAERVYVRDDVYTERLKEYNIKYELTRDLSYYMQPEMWEVDIPQGSVGLNISGLAYMNNFPGLQGQFSIYPLLIECIIEMFQKKNITIFLIPHSYNFVKPESNNDDLEACTIVYNKLRNKSNIVLVNRDMVSPQIKYLISRMSFFIGTRMHANFAAIYTGVPVFGLAYSSKFEEGFNANGLDGSLQTARINNLGEDDIQTVLHKIENVYSKEVE